MMAPIVEIENDGYVVSFTIASIVLFRGTELVTTFPIDVEKAKDIAHAALGLAGYLASAKRNEERRR
jgi:hypothetical protein